MKYKLGEICEIARGGSPRPIIDFITNDEDGINWLKIGDVAEGDKYFNHANERIKPEGRAKSRDVVKGDLILSNSMSFGRPYIINIDGCIHDGWLRVRNNRKLIDREYLYYFLCSDVAQNQFKAFAVGSVVNNLKSETVRDVEIDLPSLDVQKQIANILSELDNKIENNRKINHHLAELLQVNLKRHLESIDGLRRVGDLPLIVSDHVANGSFRSLKDNVKLVETPDYALFLRNVDLKNDLNGERRWVTESSYNFLKKSRLHGHEVIISNVADVGTVHRVPSLDVPMVAGNNVVFLKAKNSFLTDYLYVYFNSKFGQHDIASITSGSAQQKFNKTDFRNLKIPILDDEIIKSQITPLLHYMDNSKSEISDLIQLRDILLPKLMSGEISVD